MITQQANSGKVEYEWEGRKKTLYYVYSKPIDSYVAVSIYEEELMQIITSVRITIGVAIFVITSYSIHYTKLYELPITTH